jgi:threonylcarbamoyladenosine tRNA methylthiotransferase MtaB
MEIRKTFSIKTLGCKLNQYDSAKIAAEFESYGWTQKRFGEMCDLVIINTCTVTDKSDKKCRNYIRQGARFSKYGKAVVTGCMADAVEHDDDILAVFNNADKNLLYQKIISLSEYRSAAADAGASKIIRDGRRARASIKVQDGCDGNCTYCIVPSVRGVPVSRGAREIIDEAKRLVDSGIPEIILTGITIGKYNDNGTDLAGLALAVAALDGNFRVRVTSIEPLHVTKKLIELYAHPKICSHIHLPLQSGTDRILQLMNRPYRLREFAAVVELFRSAHPAISIGSDIIVGFPGETRDEFVSSLDFIRAMAFSHIHQFTFSPRRNTIAAELDGKVASPELEYRGKLLRALSEELGRQYENRFVGEKLRSVIELKGNLAVSDNYIKFRVKSEIVPEKRGVLTDIEFFSGDSASFDAI